MGGIIAAEAEPLYVTLIKVLVPIIVSGIITLVVWYLNRKTSVKDGKGKVIAEAYKVDVEQTTKQREFLITENQSLYALLKGELDMCRQERIELDHTIASLNETIDNLKKRLSKIEIDLQAWEAGLKTPKGFILKKIEDEDDESPEGL